MLRGKPRLKLEYGWNRGAFLYGQITKQMIGGINTSKLGCQLIAECVSRVPGGIYVETGTQWGGTALIAALMMVGGGHIYAIDPLSDNGYYGGVDPYTHIKPHAKFLQANFKRFGVEHRLTHIDQPSHPWPYPGVCDVAFIDGDHTLPVALYDWNNLKERTTRYIIFDNIEIDHPDVSMVWDLACSDKNWRLAALVGEVGVVERVDR